TLEGGAVAAAFASGNAATSAVFYALKPGDHVILPAETYHGTRLIAQRFAQQWGLQVSFVPMDDLDAVRRAFRPNTCLVWVETPSNPRLFISDIAQIAALAHAHGARCVCDNTLATPVLQNPLALGADLVTHSTTKYIGGHSDLLGGCVIAREHDAFFERIRDYQVLGGAVPSAFDCWLLLRSMQTLPLRVRAQSASALRVAHFLAQHPRVRRAYYPGLPTHPGHAIAAAQMRDGFGGIVSFELAGTEAEALALAGRLRVFTHATSLGGVESLVDHRASVEGAHSVLPRSLLRLSIGLEHPDDLIADLDRALASL
ncbi:MAG: aminotransferase class V-fold PLP-dependent enzyme, partial [Thermoflexales bacterium]|nr:aminotransferase class V-fold PLP-dependent enzyme [Thermoflexales bacterium]